MNLVKHMKEIRGWVSNGQWRRTLAGILVNDRVYVQGTYYHTVNGFDERIDHNLLTTESIHNILDVVYGATSKQSTWYLSLYSGNATPIASWTAANYVANATENTSQTEGYSGANRPEWVDSVAAAGKIGNLSSRASYTIVATTTVTFYGAAMHSVQTRGAVTGVLGSATRFSSSRTLDDGDTFEVGYEVQLTDS
jgi:hypothetical protein